MRCYYTEIHPFLPLLPPLHNIKCVLQALLPESPFCLAVQAILVLVPHPQDSNPKSTDSKRLRCATSNDFGRLTMNLIESTLENPTLETVQALCILSLWEWGNSGNLARSRSRSDQAVQVAMELGIHELDKYASEERSMEGEDWRRDMARRTWWQVYAAQITSALVSGTSPVVGPDDPRVQVHFPVCSLDDNTWPNWVNTLRQCSRVFAIVNAVYYSERADIAAWGSRPDAATVEAMEEMKHQVLEIDRRVVELMKQAEDTAIIELVPGGEEEVVRNQQTAVRLGLATTHIHIHRYQAFPEVSLFSKKICGLPQAPDFGVTRPMLDNVAVPQALANGPPIPVYDESPAYRAANATMGMNGNVALHEKMKCTNKDLNRTHSSGDDGYDMEPDDFDFIDEMWKPDIYPEHLAAPWFTHAGGAASLWAPLEASPTHYPHITAFVAPTPSTSSGSRTSVISTTSQKPHKAWGVDANDQPASHAAGTDNRIIFPPGMSLARCATAAHTIVRLEVLHRSASIAMSSGPYVHILIPRPCLELTPTRPRWMPFCACGLVNGAYAFLLLALAVQAQNNFGDHSDQRADEYEALLTNVKVILAGLEAYGVMWSGIDVMAGK